MTYHFKGEPMIDGFIRRVVYNLKSSKMVVTLLLHWSEQICWIKAQLALDDGFTIIAKAVEVLKDKPWRLIDWEVN